jgi:hypothetical protein
MTKEIDFDLLEKLGNHLMNGQLGHKNFDFSCYNMDDMKSVTDCGTNGCAIGELPIIEPTRFRFCSNFVFDNGQGVFPYDNPFNLSINQYSYMFMPYYIGESRIEINKLPETATRYEVGQRILEFVQAKGNVNIYNE